MLAATVTVRSTAMVEDTATEGIRTAGKFLCRERGAQCIDSRGTQPQPEEGHTATTTAGAHNHSRGTQQVEVSKFTHCPTQPLNTETCELKFPNFALAFCAVSVTFVGLQCKNVQCTNKVACGDVAFSVTNCTNIRYVWFLRTGYIAVCR